MKVLFHIWWMSSLCIFLHAQGVRIEWMNSLEGDFLFTEQWDYQEFVFQNSHGELVCDGMCDEELADMLDEEGRILPDSIKRYYQLVDTTHYYYTLSSEAGCYEWAGSNYIHAYSLDADSVACYTACNVATHSCLQMVLTSDFCNPRIVLNSIASFEVDTFTYSGGTIQIDRSLWKKGVLKAIFDFTFKDSYGKIDPMYWKGKIYTRIEPRPDSLETVAW